MHSGTEITAHAAGNSQGGFACTRSVNPLPSHRHPGGARCPRGALQGRGLSRPALPPAWRVPILATSCTFLSLALAGCAPSPAPVLALEASAYSVPFEQYATVLVIVGLAALMAFINSALGIWDKVKPKPPLHIQFAAAEHEHAEYVRRAECHKAIERYELTSADTQRSIDTMRDAMVKGFKEVDDADEKRASSIHDRLDPLTTVVSELKGRVNDHLGRKGPHAHD